MKKFAEEALCNALIDLLEYRSIDDISITELSNLAGVTRTSYNYHFKSKLDILDAILNKHRNNLTKVLTGNLTENTVSKESEHSLTKIILNYCENNKRELLILYKHFPGHVNSFFIRTIDASLRIMAFDVTNHDGESSIVDKGRVYDFIIHQITYRLTSYIVYWFEMEQDYTLEEILTIMEKVSSFKILTMEPKR